MAGLNANAAILDKLSGCSPERLCEIWDWTEKQSISAECIIIRDGIMKVIERNWPSVFDNWMNNEHEHNTAGDDPAYWFKRQNNPATRKKLAFKLGRLVATQGISEAMRDDDTFRKEIDECMSRYIRCDWGDLDEWDWKANDAAVVGGDDRILAAYMTSNGRVYIITEYDGSVTTVLLAEEY